MLRSVEACVAVGLIVVASTSTAVGQAGPCPWSIEYFECLHGAVCCICYSGGDMGFARCESHVGECENVEQCEAVASRLFERVQLLAKEGKASHSFDEVVARFSRWLRWRDDRKAIALIDCNGQEVGEVVMAPAR